jgi:hypothetical protein
MMILGAVACSDRTKEVPPECVNSVSNATLSLVGEINAGMARYAAQQVGSRPIRDVRISSAGGDDVSAIAISELLQKYHLRIVVYRACVSACASYLFLAAPERLVCPHALVMFHHTANSLLKLADNDPNLPVRTLYPSLAARGEALLRQNQVSSVLLLQPQLEIGTSCYWSRINADGRADIGYQARANLWVPSQQFMEAAGVTIQGYWPENASSLLKDLRTDFHSISNLTFVFDGSSKPLSRDVLDARYSKIPVCHT